MQYQATLLFRLLLFLIFFSLFLLLKTFTSCLRQYPVISGNYPTYPALEWCKGRGRDRTFVAKFLFVCQWHPAGSNAISGRFICFWGQLKTSINCRLIDVKFSELPKNCSMFSLEATLWCLGCSWYLRVLEWELVLIWLRSRRGLNLR